MRGMALCILLLATSQLNSVLAQVAVNPVVYNSPGAQYLQNFDGLPGSGTFTLSGKGPFNLSSSPINSNNLAGWQILMPGGSNTNAAFAVGTGSSTGNGIYSLGSSGSAERALGSLSSSTGIYSMGLILTNNTGSVLNTLTISFTAEQWRKGGSTNKNIWSFGYKTGIITQMDQPDLLDEPNLNFSSVVNTSSATSLNGNLSDNQQTVSYTMHNITWKAGEQLLLRWDDADEAGSDDVVGIDNFSFSATLVSTSPTINNVVASNITTGSAELSASVNDNYANTSVVFEYDTLNTLPAPIKIRASQDTLHAGSGNTNVSATVNGLSSGTTYYFRIKTNNINGTVTGTIQNFATLIKLPTVNTTIVSAVSTNTAILGGNITATGGTAVTEKGIVWSVNTNPTILNTKIIMGSGTGNFLQTVNGLPQGTIIYVKAYAINAGGIAYGDTIRFATQTMITSFNTTATGKTNATSVGFIFKTAQNISGLTASNFSLQTNNLSGVSITGITGSANSYTLTVTTGTGDGTLGISFSNDAGLSIPINNKTFTATNYYTIDKTVPQINSVSIPDKTMKTGDTIPVNIFVKPETDIYKMVSGNIDGFALSGFNKKNDSTYTAWFLITNGGNDIDAAADIPVMFSLIDSAGNSSQFQVPIKQQSDRIDANKPFILSVLNPPKGMYKAGDTLSFIFRFSEKVVVFSGGIPSLSLTVGTKSKTAVYLTGSGSDSLLFRYIVSNGDFDTDGIKTAGTITLNNASIRDIAGNIATVSFNNTLATKDILVDGIVPAISNVTVPEAAEYKTGNILDFIINYTKKVFIAAENFPTLSVNIGTGLKNATYINGSGTNALLFRYNIQSDDIDTDGIKLSASLNDANFVIRDSIGNRAPATLNNVGIMTGVHINTPSITISNVIVPDNGIYKTGDTLEFIINYNERISVTTTNGIPALKITVGSSSKQAIYMSGSGSNSLLFAYIIQAGDEDTDGIKVNGLLSLNNGNIKDAQGNNAPVIFNSILNTNGILIDAVSPVINNIFVPDNSIYKAGDTLGFIFHFSEPVNISIKKDTPVLKLTIGSTQKNMLYTSGSGTADILFRYIVKPGDLDKNGISIGLSISLNNAVITDFAGNTASVNFKNPAALSLVKIDAIAPVFITNKTETVSVCGNNASTLLSNLFTVSDEESGELISWKIKTIPKYGSLLKNLVTATSNGKNISPPVIEYKPYKEQYGYDTLVAELTDGINTSQKTIIINLQPSLQNNFISSSQLICNNQAASPLSGGAVSGGDGNYTYIWESATTVDSSHFGIATGTNDQQEYVPASLNGSSWYRRRIVSGACTDTSSPVKITVIKNGLWLGNIDHNWHNTNNWCGNILPGSSTDVFVYANTMYSPQIKDSAWCNQLTIANNAHLKITGILQVSGNISAANGSVQSDSGTILLNGISQQNINGKIFETQSLQNLLINNHAGVSLLDDLTITGKLVLNGGYLQTNDHLTLKHTAVIGPSATGTTVTGNVSIEHFIKGGRRCFWLLGHPFSDAAGLQMIKDSLDITGDGGDINGFITTATNQPSAFRYDPLVGNDSSGIDAGWIPFTHTNGLVDNAWKKYNGIRLLVRGKQGQGLDGTPAGDGKNGTYLPEPVIIKLSGKINSGDQEISLPKDKYGTYHVLANPYAANTDLSRITKGNDIGSYYWIWNPQQGTKGGYTSFPFRSKNIISPFSAFIAKANGNSNNKILFTENSKSADLISDSIAAVVLDDIFYLELRLESDSIFWDRLVILAMDSAKTYFDKNDAEKFRNSEVNFYSISREQKILSIDARPVNNESVIALGLQTDEVRTFRIRVVKNSLPSSSNLMLHDKYLNTWMALEKDTTYLFSTTSDSNSYGNKRFEITSKKKAVDTVTYKPNIILKTNPVPARDKIIVQYNSPEKGNTSIRILTLSGTPVKTMQLGLQKDGQVTVTIGELLKGIYLLELRCGNEMLTKKIIKE